MSHTDMEPPHGFMHLGAPARTWPTIPPTEPTPLVDTLFKQIFADPRMIEVLIRTHLPEWADGVDYRTLEPLPTEHVTDDRRSLFSDMAWRLRSVDGGTDHVLMIEFQGRSERAMAVRTTAYGSLAVLRLMRGDGELRSGERGLALASLVLYHDDRPWNAPRGMGDVLKNSEPDRYRLVAPAPPDEPAPTAPGPAAGPARTRQCTGDRENRGRVADAGRGESGIRGRGLGPVLDEKGA